MLFARLTTLALTLAFSTGSPIEHPSPFPDGTAVVEYDPTAHWATFYRSDKSKIGRQYWDPSEKFKPAAPPKNCNLLSTEAYYTSEEDNIYNTLRS